MQKAARLAYLHTQLNANQPLSLLVLHGMMGSKNNFRSIVKHPSISDQLQQTYLIDLRNHGDSEHTPTMTFDDLALDLKHFIDITQLKDLVLLGHSYGGRNIFGYLQNYPDHAKERVKGVVIVDIVPTALNSLVPDLLEKLIKVNLNDRSYNDIKQELMTVAGDPAIGALVMSNIYSEVMINTLERQNFKWRINLKSIYESFQYNVHHEFVFQWPGPASVICGDRSEYVGEADRPRFKKIFPNMDVQRDIHFVPNCGHWVHAEKPYEFIKLVSDFIKSI